MTCHTVDAGRDYSIRASLGSFVDQSEQRHPNAAARIFLVENAPG